MFPSKIPQLNIDDLTTFNNNSYCGGSFGFDEFNYLDPSHVAGPSQKYTGVDVLGNFNDFPDFPTTLTTQVSLDSARGLCPYEGKLCRASR